MKCVCYSVESPVCHQCIAHMTFQVKHINDGVTNTKLIVALIILDLLIEWKQKGAKEIFLRSIDNRSMKYVEFIAEGYQGGIFVIN